MDADDVLGLHAVEWEPPVAAADVVLVAAFVVMAVALLSIRGETDPVVADLKLATGFVAFFAAGVSAFVGRP